MKINLKPYKGEIIDALKFALKERNEQLSVNHKNKIHFSPTDTDKCPRQLWYEFKDFPVEEYSDTELSTFAIGQITHDFLESIMPNQLCAEFRIDTSWRGFPVAGYVDSIVLTKKGVAVVDFKTIKDSGIKYIEDEPKKAHIKQVNLYMDILGIPRGFLLYWNKADGTMLQHKVKYDKKILDEIEILFREVQEHLKANKPPEIHYDPNNWKCRYCKYVRLCKKEVDKV